MNKAIFFAFLIAFAAAEYTIDEGVYVLTQDNFDAAIAEFDFALVEFYAPWCGHCKKLAPEYAKAAQELAESNPEIKLCKVDATEEKDLSSKFGVRGFPTLKFFLKGSSSAIDYEGGRTHPEIVSWLKKRTGPVSVAVESVADLEKRVADNELVGAFFGSEGSKAWSDFVSVAGSHDDIVFVHTDNADIRAHFEAEEENFVLFKKFDEGKNVFKGPWSSTDIKNFVQENKFPLVMGFDQKEAQRIFGEGLSSLFLITSGNDASAAAEEAFRSVAKDLKGKITLSIAKLGEGLGDRLAEFIGVTQEHTPALRIVLPNQDMKKFQFDGEINGDNIKAFVDDWANGRLKPFLKSEPIPESNNEPVKVVVGKSFQEVVIDSDDDVLMEFYAPWCGHCKALAPTYDALAKKLENVSGLVIAKMDATANEAEGVNIRGFPTLKFYKRGSKSRPMDFEGDRTEEGFIQFLKENSSADFSSLDNAKPTDTDL
mmetsp:Transcript_34930/g.31463  ORF Transcript_34930/g.31463 Transcript_34930/m.31463 type:complete len:484 (-) Transcript_34930:262-1713(-)|eukprot:CAMPEP_0114587202 /NCGR_PEP_ID=MMETSP0125-20121206/10223_1 /TAXON_ID=485358 ORGANISM="Aristerostoma sp., Strain ATCC 50986" /NCGR_SAMPLE_ID=MMETSP0125 /ASSEMBLY_ACC=CAM_ASM_000245 /LENGTH=483 /DNA_ID=CAMNT_0001782999 /DNA_START=42 /DNA_END=1493 /DNA_ORIENTATION=-